MHESTTVSVASSSNNMLATPKPDKFKSRVYEVEIKSEEDCDDFIPLNMISGSYVDSGKKHMN